MQPIIILFILGALAVAILGGNLPFSSMQANVSNTLSFPQVQQTSQQTSQQAPQENVSSVRSLASKSPNYYVSPTLRTSSLVSSVSIDTFIKFGPNDKEVISETNKVAFEFGAEVTPQDTQGQITFETKLIGFDNDWKETYGSQRTIDLPSGVKEYTFLVRAKINNIVDLTPAKRTFKLNISPYFGKVEISNVAPPDATNNYSLITLKAEIGEKEKINITGWKFEGEYGNFIIPQGIEQFNPLFRPLLLKDIVIKQKDVIYLSSKANPLGERDFNFRTNKCMGYLAGSINFPISISKNCPMPQVLPSSLKNCCQKYIFSLGTCQSPTYQGIEDNELLKDESCRSFMETNLTYGGCYANYYRDQNFWENQWHVYLDRTDKEIMDMNTDTIYLRDRNGLLIDKYSYGENGTHGSSHHFR